MSELLVYVTIGNSDNRLTQHRWSRFISGTRAVIEAHVARIHGIWFSDPSGPYQNACFGFEVPEDVAESLRAALNSLRIFYDQESIAWATATLDMVREGSE